MKKIMVLMLMLISPVNAGVYKWTDSEGNVHFGDRPANAESATEIQIRSNDKAGITNSSGNKKEREYLLKKIDEENRAEADRKKKQNAKAKRNRELCKSYKSRYQSIIQSSRSYVMSPDGERTYLSGEQREARKKKLKKGMSRYCR